MYDLVLKNGKIVSPEGIREGDVVISGGKIVDIVDHFEGEAKDVRDVAGKFILPGVIDVHVHFREPGSSEKEDWNCGSKAAVSGGVTTVLDMPNNNPPTVSVESLNKKKDFMESRSIVNYGFYLGVTKKNLDELKKAENVAGFKVYLGSSTGDLLMDDLEVLEKVMQETERLIAVHAEDEEIIQRNSAQFKEEKAAEVHSKIRSHAAAYESLKKALHLAKKHGRRMHVCHVSTGVEVDELRKFKASWLSAEVATHHLFLDKAHYAKQGHFVKMNPPLREKEDREKLWEALRDGTIQMVATDHAPHLVHEKEVDYLEAPSGVPGVETLLPLMLDAVNHGELDLKQLVLVLSVNPARLFGIKGKGEIKVGADADITVVDMELEKEVKNENLYTKCEWSPYAGRNLQGWPVMTIVDGNLTFVEGKINTGFRGQEVKFES